MAARSLRGSVVFAWAFATTLQLASAQPRETSRIERPPVGSWQRGAVPMPKWAVISFGAVAAASAIVFLARRARNRKNR